MILTPIPSLTPLTTEVKCIVDSIQCDTIDNNRRSARTTLLLCRRICAPPELIIKICNLITSYVALHHNFSVS